MCMLDIFFEYAVDVSIGTSEVVVIAWWGPGQIQRGHILGEPPEVNSILCHPEEEETLLSTQSTGHGWMNLLLKQCPLFVVDVYSISGKCFDYVHADGNVIWGEGGWGLNADNLSLALVFITLGELTQLCMGKGVKCTAVQSSEGKATELAKNLNIPVTGDAVHNEGAQVGSLDKVQCIGSNQGEVGVNHDEGFGSDDVRVRESDVSGVQVGGGTGGSDEVSGRGAMIQDTPGLLAELSAAAGGGGGGGGGVQNTPTLLAELSALEKRAVNSDVDDVEGTRSDVEGTRSDVEGTQSDVQARRKRRRYGNSNRRGRGRK